MRAVLFLSLLSLSACVADIPTRPSTCYQVVQPERFEEACAFYRTHGYVCSVTPVGPTHEVTVCRL